MPSTDRLIAFVLASIILVVIPGLSVLFVVSRAIAHGRRAALGSVLGNSAGVAVLVVLVAFGLGTVVERSMVLFTAIKLVGAAYLVYLGVRTWLERGHLGDALSGATPDGMVANVVRVGGLTMVGLGMGLALTGRRE